MNRKMNILVIVSIILGFLLLSTNSTPISAAPAREAIVKNSVIETYTTSYIPIDTVTNWRTIWYTDYCRFLYTTKTKKETLTRITETTKYHYEFK